VRRPLNEKATTMLKNRSWLIALALLVVVSLGCNTSLGTNLYTAEETVKQAFEVGASLRVVVETL
jgi:uncharacterized protein involved in exopolysaccharide biosynthesis